MVRQLLVVAILLTFVMTATPAMADCTNHEVTDDDIIMVSEDASGEVTTVYMVKATPDSCGGCGATEEKSNPVEFFGLIHGDALYPQDGSEEIRIDRIRAQWIWTINDNWLAKFRTDYRYYLDGVKTQHAFMKFQEDDWNVTFGRVFVYATTPAPQHNRFAGYSPQITGVLEGPGIIVGKMCGGIDLSVALINENDTIRGRYNGVAVVGSTTTQDGVVLTAMGYRADGKQIWGLDSIIPIDNRGSQVWYTIAGDEGSDKSHSQNIELWCALDDDQCWWLNCGYYYGRTAGNTYRTIPISINYDWDTIGGVPIRTILEYRMDRITGDNKVSFRCQFPLSSFGL